MTEQVVSSNPFTVSVYNHFIKQGKKLSKDVIEVLDKSLLELNADEQKTYNGYILPAREGIRIALEEELRQCELNATRENLKSVGDTIVGQIAIEVIKKLEEERKLLQKEEKRKRATKQAIIISASVIMALIIATGLIVYKVIDDQQQNKKNAQELLDNYVSYLETEDQGILNDILGKYPKLITRSEKGISINEDALVAYVKSYSADTSALDVYHKNLFDSKKFPLSAGTEEEVYTSSYFDTNTKTWFEGPVAVNFSLEGPWDFSQGPTNSIIDMTTRSATTDPNISKYPGASFMKSYPLPYGTSSIFYSKDNESVAELGNIVDTSSYGGSLTYYTVSSPNYLVRFPLKIGETWTCYFEDRKNGKTTDTFQKTKTVISKNGIAVPAGTYQDAYLVQVRNIMVSEGVTTKNTSYVWYVPYIGEVAQIVSMDNEPADVFTQASSFRRLKYTSNYQPE